MNLDQYLIDLGTTLATIMAVTEFVTQKMGLHKLKAQIASWVIAFIVAAVAVWQGLGMFADMTPLVAAVNAFFIGLMANGASNIPLLKTLLDALVSFLTPKPKED